MHAVRRIEGDTMERAIVCMRSGTDQVDIEVDGHLLVAADPGGGASEQGRSAPSPYGMLLASLGACTAFSLRQCAARQNWPLESLDIFLTLSHDACGLYVERMLLITGVDRACQQALLDHASQTPLTVLLGTCMRISTTLI